MGKRRTLRTEVDTHNFDSLIKQVSKQLGVIFKGGNKQYWYGNRRGEELTLSVRDGSIFVTLHGLDFVPRVTTRASQTIDVDSLVGIVRSRLDMMRQQG